MAKLAMKPGSTSVSLYLFIQNSSLTTGAGLTGLVFNSASLTAYYVRPLGSATAITLATQTVTGAWSSGGFVEVDSANLPGIYRFDVPDAVLATGVRSAAVLLKGATNMAPVTLELDLNAQVNVEQFGGTNGTFAAGRPEVNTSHAAGTAWGSGAITAGSVAAAALNGKGDWNIGKTGYALSAAGVQAVWDALTSALTTVGSIGKLLVDNVNATISSRSSHAAADVWAVGTRTLTAFSFAVDVSAAAVTLIWDKATSALTTVGSIGKLLVDNLNAAITSRSSHTAADVWASATRTLTAATNITSTGGTTVPQTGDSFARLGAAGAGLTAVPWNASWDVEVESEVLDALNTILADSVPADGTLPTARQALYMTWQFLAERSVSGTTLTIRKADGSTALMTFTLSDATSPTSITRAT